MRLVAGWNLSWVVDDDAHLNVYITNDYSGEVLEVDTGQGDGHGEQLAIRLTTPVIERDNQIIEQGVAHVQKVLAAKRRERDS